VAEVASGIREVHRALIGPVLDGPAELRRYLGELEDDGLRGRMEELRAGFERTVTGTTSRGDAYGFAPLKWEKCEALYALIRKRRPAVLVETGVCNGVSTAVILLALERNGAGALHSVDLPEYTGIEYPRDAFWEGKKGAAVPRGKEPGWVIPAGLKERWELLIGRSQDVLGGLLERLGRIDFFLHDSEHSYECMSFELRLATAHLRPGGILAADDTQWNSAFADFAEQRSLVPRSLGAGLAFAIV